MACSSISKNSTDDYISDSNETVYFKMIKSVKDIEDDVDENIFHPEFSHQFFGENENIFGFKNLKIRLFYTASQLYRYINMSYSDKIKVDKDNDVAADNVIEILSKNMDGDFYTNVDELCSVLEKESLFKPHGELINSFSIDNQNADRDTNETACQRSFHVFKPDMSYAGFREYHDRMQTFLMWFIDAASYIDVDDDRWDFFLVYESSNNFDSVQNGVKSGKNVYHFIGFTTVYRYYAYPEKIRPRISQVLILPPYQRKGIGVHLLQSIYNFYCGDKSVLDITVEDPSENFTRVRDFTDAKNCSTLSSFSPDNLTKGWNDIMIKEAQDKLKLNRKQARKMYELLKLRKIDRSNVKEYKDYRIEVKRRLNAPFVKLNRGSLSADERSTLLGDEMHLDDLHRQYIELEEYYYKIIERLAIN